MCWTRCSRTRVSGHQQDLLSQWRVLSVLNITGFTTHCTCKSNIHSFPQEVPSPQSPKQPQLGQLHQRQCKSPHSKALFKRSPGFSLTKALNKGLI